MGCVNTRSYNQQKKKSKTIQRSKMHSNPSNKMSEVKIEGLEDSDHRFSLFGQEDNPQEVRNPVHKPADIPKIGFNSIKEEPEQQIMIYPPSHTSLTKQEQIQKRVTQTEISEKKQRIPQPPIDLRTTQIINQIREEAFQQKQYIAGLSEIKEEERQSERVGSSIYQAKFASEIHISNKISSGIDFSSDGNDLRFTPTINKFCCPVVDLNQSFGEVRSEGEGIYYPSNSLQMGRLRVSINDDNL